MVDLSLPELDSVRPGALLPAPRACHPARVEFPWDTNASPRDARLYARQCLPLTPQKKGLIVSLQLGRAPPLALGLERVCCTCAAPPPTLNPRVLLPMSTPLPAHLLSYYFITRPYRTQRCQLQLRAATHPQIRHPAETHSLSTYLLPYYPHYRVSVTTRSPPPPPLRPHAPPHPHPAAPIPIPASRAPRQATSHHPYCPDPS